MNAGLRAVILVWKGSRASCRICFDKRRHYERIASLFGISRILLVGTATLHVEDVAQLNGFWRSTSIFGCEVQVCSMAN